MGFVKTVQFKASDGLRRQVSFRQQGAVASGGAAIQWVERLPDQGNEQYIYALIRKHQIAPPYENPTVSFYVCRSGQYYAVSDPRLVHVNTDIIRAEHDAHDAYWACANEKTEAINLLYRLQEETPPNEEAIQEVRQKITQLKSRLIQLNEDYNACKAAADIARQEAKARDDNQ